MHGWRIPAAVQLQSEEEIEGAGVLKIMKTSVFTADAPRPIGPYSQAVKVGNLLFASGQIPVDPATGKLVEGGLAEQTHQVFKNIAAVLKAAGVTFDDVCKTTVYLKDMGDFAAMNEIYSQYFTGEILPARSAFQVGKLPKDSRLEIEVIAQL